jgi:hypothetical protein
MGGILAIATAICGELLVRLPWQNKKQREGLALLIATALQVRSVNLNELAAALPRAADRLDMRYQWISRVLGNELIKVEDVMAPFAREVLARSAAGGQTIIMIDQSKVNDAHQMLMVSVRVGGRALPLAWHMKKTQGSIGFSEQKGVLETVVKLLPKGAAVMLMGDRFYGSPALIEWCRQQGWGWRLRCKRDLLVFGKDGSETTLADCFARGEPMLTDVELTEKRARTNIAMLHEQGHAEPWIIALSDRPTTWRAYDYSLRWGIEAMFSDYKTRGFNLEDSQIERTDRLDRLVLVLSLALYWAVSAGMWDAMENMRPAEKKPRRRNARTLRAA